jgi:molecular chaperone DnaK (HSP70)
MYYSDKPLLDKLAAGGKATIAVVDSGGGTTDVTVFDYFPPSRSGWIADLLRVPSKSRLVFRATAGDNALGGEDVDDRILNVLAKDTGIELPKLCKKTRAQLLQHCRKMKEQLSTTKTVALAIC